MSDHPRGQPRQPSEPTPHEGGSPGADAEGRTPNGIPEEAGQHEPTGLPNSDRHQTETTPGKP